MKHSTIGGGGGGCEYLETIHSPDLRKCYAQIKFEYGVCYTLAITTANFGKHLKIYYNLKAHSKV